MNNFFKTRHNEIIICLFLIVTTLAVYWEVTNHEFLNYDDNIYITENINVQYKGAGEMRYLWLGD